MERIYALICSDYDAQLVHIDGDGDVVAVENKEGNSLEDQLFDKSSQRNETAEIYPNQITTYIASFVMPFFT